MLQGVLEAIRSVPAAATYAIIAVVVFAEAAVFVGFVLPAEAAVLLGGFLASQGHLDIVPLIVIVVVSAVVGDTVGYEVGRRVGPRVLQLRLVRRRRAAIERARGTLRRRGGPAIFLGRWTAFLRAVLPGLAGLSRMRYPTFLTWNALGGLTWGITMCLVGYYAGASYEKVASTIGDVTAGIVAVLVVTALVGWRLRRRRGRPSGSRPSSRGAQ